MEKCFIKKSLKSCNNQNLAKLGQIAIKLQAGNRTVTVAYPSTEELNILNGYFSDSSYSSNKGDKMAVQYSPDFTTLYVHADEGCILFLPFYHLRTLEISGTVDMKVSSFEFSDTNLYNFSIRTNTESSKTLELSKFIARKAIAGIIYCNFLIGDISVLSNQTGLTNLYLVNNKITGDLSSLTAKELTYFETGRSNLEWNTDRSSDCKIMSILGNPKINNVDRMLKNQANCVVPRSESRKVINVAGTRTSASDDAIASLQNKGYTVLITPA